jgi:alkanesulfonate monooxygenase SsuD/methylene tetrahydromethanopterin reductase-like flavin-dependent oxidoreductase (luciferase family)
VPSFGVRYDLRCPSFAGTSHAALHATALEQCAWADRLRFATVTLSEHHGSPDGYLPSPLVFGAAAAARTERLHILFAALIAPLHDPIRLAEDIAVLDVVSGGRVIPVLSAGYVESEFATFGRRLEERREVMETIVPLLEKAWTGEPFEHRGRSVRVTPRPVQRPRPPILMGGGSAVAARRAARLADAFVPSTPDCFEIFRNERRRLGKPDPGPHVASLGKFLWVSEEPDAAWERIAPHAMHETNAYGRWAQEAGVASPYQPADHPDELRARGSYPVFTPEEFVEKARALPSPRIVELHPLMGGLDPAFSWEFLRLFESKLLPALRG